MRGQTPCEHDPKIVGLLPCVRAGGAVSDRRHGIRRFIFVRAGGPMPSSIPERSATVYFCVRGQAPAWAVLEHVGFILACVWKGTFVRATWLRCGLSPRAWGRDCQAKVRCWSRRFIPARVGKGTGERQGRRASMVYPRARRLGASWPFAMLSVGEGLLRVPGVDTHEF